MPIADPEKIWPKLEQAGVEEVRKKVAMGVYADYKIPVIGEWLRRKEEERNAPTYMYHEFEAPEGKVFPASEVPTLERAGWVDTPAKFGKGLRSKWLRASLILSSFWGQHWKWIVTTLLTVIGILVAMLM